MPARPGSRTRPPQRTSARRSPGVLEALVIGGQQGKELRGANDGSARGREVGADRAGCARREGRLLKGQERRRNLWIDVVISGVEAQHPRCLGIGLGEDLQLHPGFHLSDAVLLGDGFRRPEFGHEVQRI